MNCIEILSVKVLTKKNGDKFSKGTCLVEGRELPFVYFTEVLKRGHYEGEYEIKIDSYTQKETVKPKWNCTWDLQQEMELSEEELEDERNRAQFGNPYPNSESTSFVYQTKKGMGQTPTKIPEPQIEKLAALTSDNMPICLMTEQQLILEYALLNKYKQRDSKGGYGARQGAINNLLQARKEEEGRTARHKALLEAITIGLNALVPIEARIDKMESKAQATEVTMEEILQEEHAQKEGKQ